MGRPALQKGVITECGFRLLQRFSARIAFFTGMVFSIVSAQNSIDAVTSASGDLKLKSGKAYATEAVIVWSDHRSNGTVQTLEWGTSDSYGESMNLKPLTRDVDITDTLKPLTPSTKYYAKFHRVYPMRNADITTTFEFTTTASTPVVPFAESHAFFSAPKATHLSLFSTNGRRIAELSYSDRAITLEDLKGIVTPGLYIAVTSDDNHRQLQSSKVIIGK